ncbi:MAG: hypothetical protein KDJ38_09465 [Gammaproteobacteria bacterium]|nr:hypothetical protein [Gammaproteobacteria bacterium]
METSIVQLVKLEIVQTLGLSKDALHVYVGLAVFMLVVAAKKSVRSMLPWLAVLAVAVVGEILDRRDDIASLGHWRWTASLHDVLNTLFWPTVLMLSARLGIIGTGGDYKL